MNQLTCSLTTHILTLFIHSSIISTWFDDHQQQQPLKQNVLDKRKHKRDDNKSKLNKNIVKNGYYNQCRVHTAKAQRSD